MLQTKQRPAHRRSATVAPDETSDLGRLSQAAQLKAHLEHRAEQLKSRAKAQGDAEAELYLELQLECVRNGSAPLKNQEAAEALGITPPDIVNVTKRIQRMAQ